MGTYFGSLFGCIVAYYLVYVRSPCHDEFLTLSVEEEPVDPAVLLVAAGDEADEASAEEWGCVSSLELKIGIALCSLAVIGLLNSSRFTQIDDKERESFAIC